MPTPEEIKAEMAGKFGSEKDKEAGKTTTPPDDKAAQDKAAAEKAEADKKAAEAAKPKFDPDDLLSDEPEKKDEPLPTYEEVSKDEAKRKAAFEHQRKIIGDLKQQLKDLEGKAPNDTEDVKALKARLAQYNAAEDPDFQRDYIQPVNQTWSEIEGTLKQLEIPADQIAQLQRTNLAQRLTLLPTILKGKEAAIPYLSPMFADLDKKRASAATAYQKAEESLKKSKADRSKSMETQIGTVAEGVILEMAKHHPALARDPAKPEKNARIDKDVAEAKSMASKLGGDPKYAFETAMLAVLGKRYAAGFANATKNLSDTDKQRIALMRSRPSIGGNGSGSSTTETEKPDFTKVPHHKQGEAIRETIARRAGHS